MRRRRRAERAPAEPARVRLELTDIAFGGEAIGRFEGRVVFVPRGLPGEEVEVELVEEHADYARGSVVEVCRASPDRVVPPCQHFLEGCGGCQWQHVRYERQLGFKRQIVADQLRRIGGFGDADRLVQPVIGMLDPWHYRNHARFSVGRRYGELCFTRQGTRRLMRIDHCWIMQAPINDLLGRLQGTLRGLRAHQVAIRVGANTGDVLVNPALPSAPDLASGQESLCEELLGRRFRIAAPAFFQVNTRREQREPPQIAERFRRLIPPTGLAIADILVLLVLDRLDPSPNDTVVDAYCGVGTFTALVSPYVREAIGIEESTAAVADAEWNTADLPNTRFIAGKTEDVLPRLDRRPTKVLLDPARVGCERQVLDALIAASPERIVYVSCDPATLARDLAILRGGGYLLQSVQPVDMFPQTYHVESVSLLTLG